MTFTPKLGKVIENPISEQTNLSSSSGFTPKLGKVITSDGGSSVTEQKPQEGFATKAKKGIFSFLSKTKASAATRGKEMLDAFGNAYNEIKSPEKTTPLQQVGVGARTGLRTIGAVAGFAGDTLGNAAVETAKVVLPEQAKENIKTNLGKGAEAIRLPEMMQQYNEWAQKHPEASKDLEATANIASFLPIERVASIGTKTALNAAEKAAVKTTETTAKAVAGTKRLATEAIDSAKTLSKTTVESVQDTAMKGLEAMDMSRTLDDSVKNSISGSAKKGGLPEQEIERYYALAEKARATTGELTPLEIAGEEHLGGALKDLNLKMQKAGEAQSVALKQNAEKPVLTKQAYDNFTTKMDERLGTNFDPDGNLVPAKGRVSLVVGSPADEKLVQYVRTTIDTLKRKPTLQQVNDVVDRLGSELYKSKQVGAIAINGKTEAIVKGFVADLNKAAKEAGGEAYSKAAGEYSRLIKIRNNLNKALGEDIKNSGSLMKQVFSPAGAKVKNLIKALEKETGRPIFENATLAKFAMDLVDDPRSKSILAELAQGVPTSKGAFLGRLMSYIEKKANAPEVIKNKAIKEAKKAQESFGTTKKMVTPSP
jgi:hypothetical protein